MHQSTFYLGKVRGAVNCFLFFPQPQKRRLRCWAHLTCWKYGNGAAKLFLCDIILFSLRVDPHLVISVGISEFPSQSWAKRNVTRTGHPQRRRTSLGMHWVQNLPPPPQKKKRIFFKRKTANRGQQCPETLCFQGSLRVKMRECVDS